MRAQQPARQCCRLIGAKIACGLEFEKIKTGRLKWVWKTLSFNFFRSHSSVRHAMRVLQSRLQFAAFHSRANCQSRLFTSQNPKSKRRPPHGIHHD
jgi:hypothetical protein